MASEMKTFAFKLAEKTEVAGGKWAAREGVSALGCTDPTHVGDWRGDYDVWGIYRGRDGGEWC
jgi:hypothetical protein